MTNPKVVEGVFAINKPTGITSAQVLRDLQSHFTPSTLFAPWLSAETARLAGEHGRSNRHNGRHGRNKRLQRGLKVKIGHGGTLDPLATGVLICGVGRGTKVLGGFLDCTKSYECVMLFGAATDSYDSEGKVVARAPWEHITRQAVEEKLVGFRGRIMQRPPVFSALRVQGKRLYEYAREGKEIPVEVQARPVEVRGSHGYKVPEKEVEGEEKVIAEKLLKQAGGLADDGAAPESAAGVEKERDGEVTSAPEPVSLKRKADPLDDLVTSPPPSSKKSKTSPDPGPTMSGALPTSPDPASTSAPPSEPQPSSEPPSASQPPAIRLRMTVSSGFYVRSLCHDLAISLDSLAHMVALVRTRQGDFELGKNVLEYDDLAKGEGVWGPKVEGMLETWMEKEAEKGEDGITNEAEQIRRSEEEAGKKPSRARWNGQGRRENSSSVEPEPAVERRRRNSSSPET
ncbi:pseudouridine synthase pus4 [Coniosporium tulheliwenetii]|uniref:Pseudouridine synthase pus4 n=1 Tax=Coniosporium tulheliwenetii TaxID=3383036 RepID=A0ACC2YRC0_9PEZI|nr:pseudouridine synthase pus4 [Cladosporium sp. JES 115]